MSVVPDRVLGSLIQRVPVTETRGDLAVHVHRVDYDSRRAVAGTLFACLPGAQTDGHDYAPEAVGRGASSLLVERFLELPVPQVMVPDARAALGPIAAGLWGDPSEHLTMIGVTGTNGKTTVVHIVAAILESARRPTAVIGTLTGARTTPEAPDLQEQLASLLESGVGSVAMEVSSHALELHRVDGTRFTVAAFTNLSQDHLDFHGDLETYFAAKARLFSPAFCDLAVVNADDAWGKRLIEHVGVPVVAVHPAALERVELRRGSTTFEWRGLDVHVPLAGRFNVANAVMAAEVAYACGLTISEIVAGLAQVPPVPGRFEEVDEGQPFSVIVDYAHTPDGLERALEAAREITTGRIIAVVGCGGDRDRGKRAPMGAVATRLADEVIVTDDNPRHEDPAVIRREVLRGAAEWGPATEIADRRAAIAAALLSAREHDAVLIAGKGHETTQMIADEIVPFDDREVARSLLHSQMHGDAT